MPRHPPRHDYVELHARSAFSFHRSASHPESLVRQAAALGYPAIALTDRDGFYGSARAHYAAVRLEGGSSFRALVGAELTLEDDSVLPVLVRSRQGYRGLCRLLSTAKLRASKNASRIRWEEIPEAAPGLVALSGDAEGPLRRALSRGDRKGAQVVLDRLERAFGGDGVFVEVQRHHLRGENALNRQLIDLAQARHLPLLATNGVCYAQREDRVLYDAFTCLLHHTRLDEAGRRLSGNAERRLKSPAEMGALFADLPEALRNTRALAERLEFTLEDLGYTFPSYPVPPHHDAASFLREQTRLGARYRYGRITPQIRRQLDHELDLIERLGFSGYFLIVWEIVNFARDQGILVQGRGSAANSAVCYCLGITAVDAIKQKLLFERFLSEGRRSWPDIDLDLPSGDRREQVIQEVYRRYAPRGAAMTANVITYRGRSAMREMGKVLHLPEDTLGRFSELYGGSRANSDEELRERIAQAGLDEGHPRLPALLHLYQAVYGLPRHLGQHSGGMIISDEGLDQVVPLEPASMPGRTVVQWDKDDCEDLGIIKVDLLGLGMLAAMQDSLALCEERNRPVDLAQVPKDDPETYQLLQAADTVGVFQVESRAQMATLPRLKPETFYDLVVEVAIIRPGPIVGGMVHPYLDRRAGREPIDYIDPRFQPALERTLGVPLFQEQVLQMAMLIADFTGSEAEELRRAISFNRSEERMREVMGKLRAAMDARKVSRTTQERIVGSIQSFALYGFPESHAISFAMIAYASAWLKVHRSVEFYTGLLNNQPMGFYSPASLVRDARAHGIRVRPVCVLQSEVLCTVEDDHTLRLGLARVRGLAREHADHIVACRRQAPFADLEDFLQRSGLPKDARRLLARIGALNALQADGHRRKALWEVEAVLPADDLFAGRQARAIEDGADGKPEEAPTESDPVSSQRLALMTPQERLQADYAGLHLTTGPHPMALLRARLNHSERVDASPLGRDPKAPPLQRACDLAALPADRILHIGGLVICRQRPGTAKGHVFLSLEDETGIANAFVPAPTFEKYRLVITQEPFLEVRGRLQKLDGVTSVYTLEVRALPFPAGPTPASHDFH